MLQTCNLSSFLQFLKIFRQIGPHLQIQPRSLGPRSEGNWAYRPMGFFDGIWSETFQHAKSCWMTFWQTKESSRIHGLYCIIKYHQLSSYEIWIHMMCILSYFPKTSRISGSHLLSLWCLCTRRRLRRPEGWKGAAGGERPVAQIDTKKIPASSFQKAAIYYIWHIICVALLFCWLHIVRGDRPPDQIMTLPKYLQWTPIQAELLYAHTTLFPCYPDIPWQWLCLSISIRVFCQPIWQNIKSKPLRHQSKTPSKRSTIEKTQEKTSTSKSKSKCKKNGA